MKPVLDTTFAMEFPVDVTSTEAFALKKLAQATHVVISPNLSSLEGEKFDHSNMDTHNGGCHER